jgi:hypothetical protein
MRTYYVSYLVLDADGNSIGYGGLSYRMRTPRLDDIESLSYDIKAECDRRFLLNPGERIFVLAWSESRDR